MNANLPKNYKELASEELLYDGGFDWERFGTIAGLVASTAIMCAGVYMACNFKPVFGTKDVDKLVPKTSGYDYVTKKVTYLRHGSAAMYKAGIGMSVFGAAGMAASATCIGLHETNKL